jgi:S-(hydroxymethyl)glutathione dehydrogenase/alcohol dehydrogenase
MNGKIDIDRLVSQILPLERINDAFDAMHHGEAIRSVITF